MSQFQREKLLLKDVASYADEYQKYDFGSIVGEFDMDDPHELLKAEAWTVLKFVFRFRIFEDQAAVYNEPAAAALERLERSDEIDPDELWETFKSVCQDEYGYDLFQDKTESVIRGTVELFNQHGDFIEWIDDAVANEELDEVYDTFTSIKWVGPKITKFIIRDFVWLLDREDDVPESHAHYLHPIDGWVRSVSETIWPQLQGDGQDDISRHLAQKCREYNVSHISYNQGAFYFGAKEVGDESLLESRLAKLVNDE